MAMRLLEVREIKTIYQQQPWDRIFSLTILRSPELDIFGRYEKCCHLIHKKEAYLCLLLKITRGCRFMFEFHTFDGSG